VFTQVSRFLDEGNIMDKLVEIETAKDSGNLFEDSADDTQERFSKNKDFLNIMKEYFRDLDDI
jgi:hypothetical protein